MSNASDIAALENDIDQAIRSTRRRNTISLVLSVVGVCLVAFWLYHAHTKFVAVDPNFAADYAQARLTEYLPQAGTDLEASLIANAPQFIEHVESRLQALPDRFADELNARTRAQLRTATPQIETEIYKSMKTALDQAKAAPKGQDDAARFKALLDQLADAYRDESIKLVDQLRETHTRNGSDIVAYIKLLGENKNLDRRQQLHRDMLQQFFVIANKQSTGAGTAIPASTK
jgi:hypothetical protein